MGLVKGSSRPSSRARKPTSRAARMVPSRTPWSRWASTRDSTAAITARETSKQILVRPNSVFQVVHTARTKDSPGSMATPATTSM